MTYALSLKKSVSLTPYFVHKSSLYIEGVLRKDFYIGHSTLDIGHSNPKFRLFEN